MIKDERSETFRAGFVALVGRPSSGKSTLLNALCGQKVAITSPKPQTTRNVIRGIVNRPASQVVFLDTPGFTETEDFLAGQLREELSRAVREAEAVLYLLDLSRPPKSVPRSRSQAFTDGCAFDASQPAGGEEPGLLALLRGVIGQEACASFPLVIALNKTDLLADKSLRAQRFAQYLELLRHYFPQLSREQCFEISASKGHGLEAMLQFLGRQLPAGEPLYEADVYTDQEPQFRIQELIREQALPFCGRELPYALYVHVADLESRPLAQIDGAAAQLQGLARADWPERGLWVRAFLQVERESQKGILVGKGGIRIREICKRSSRAVRREFGCPVQLDLQVKVDYKWRRKRLR